MSLFEENDKTLHDLLDRYLGVDSGWLVQIHLLVRAESLCDSGYAFAKIFHPAPMSPG
jgi:hypothetical protein